MPALSNRAAKILLILIVLLILLIGFNLALDYYGAFWRKETEEIREPSKTIITPVTAELNQEAKEVYFEGNLLGKGYKLPAGTPVLAVIDGWFEPASSLFKKEDGTKVWSQEIMLKNRDETQEVVYSFKGEFVSPERRWVKQGEKIAILGEEILPWGEINLLFRIEKGEKAGE